jgi:molecular chaperone GrpE
MQRKHEWGDEMQEGESIPNESAAADQAALQRAEQQLAEAQDKYLRALAESENMRKRLERLCDERIWQEKKRLLTVVLEFSDHLQEALKYASKDDPLTAGLQAVQQQVHSFFDREGLEAIPATGQDFDPGLHEAVDVAQNAGRPNEVVLEYRRGYTLHGKLLRPARVQVNRVTGS